MSATNVEEQYEAHQRLEGMIKKLEARIVALEGGRAPGICGECLKPAAECICLQVKAGIRCGSCGADLTDYPTSASAHVWKASPKLDLGEE